MIYITGDTHGDFTRFRKNAFPEQISMCKDDYVIICGDFGGVWNDSKIEHNWLDWLDNKPFTTLFVSGNHENYDLLEHFNVKEWNGGKIQIIRKSLYHLMRGQVFSIDGKKIFTMGGATSNDISDGILDLTDPNYQLKKDTLDNRGAQYRINHKSWWKQELPSDEEYTKAKSNLELHNWNVDYIITHCCPAINTEDICMGLYQHDNLNEFFEEVIKRCQFKYWYFGHYHMDVVIRKKFLSMYMKIDKILSFES